MLLRRNKVNKAFYGKKKRQNCILEGISLRSAFLVLIPAIMLFLVAITPILCFLEEKSTDFEFAFNFLANDTMAIYIRPPVENISVDCNSLKSNSFRVAFFSNETQYGERFSLIYMMPRYEGKYALLVSFSSSKTWNITIGVYTSDSEFYRGAGSVMYTSPTQGYFVILHTFKVSPKNDTTSDYKIKIILQVYSKNPSIISLFNFPTPINMILFIAASIAVIYFNAFFFIDSYFKSKREGMSKARWALIALLIIISIFILYQVYNLVSGG